MELIKRIDFIAKQQNSLKGREFGDRQNDIDCLVITGVSYESVGNHINEVLGMKPEESAEEA